MGSTMQFELTVPLQLITYAEQLNRGQCFEMQAAVNGSALNSGLKVNMLEQHMELVLTGHVADIVELSSRRWKCCITSVQTNDDPADGSPDSSLIVLPQSNMTKLASVTPIIPDEIKTETEEIQTESLAPDDRALQLQLASTLPIESPIKGMVTCMQCENHFRTLHDIQNHILEVHHLTWVKYLQGITDEDLAELLTHLGTKAIATPPSQLPRVYCGNCGESFSEGVQLLEHYEEVHVKGANSRARSQSQVVLERVVLPLDASDRNEKNDNDAVEESSPKHISLPRRTRTMGGDENSKKELKSTRKRPRQAVTQLRELLLRRAKGAKVASSKVKSAENHSAQDITLPRRRKHTMRRNESSNKSKDMENKEKRLMQMAKENDKNARDITTESTKENVIRTDLDNKGNEDDDGNSRIDSESLTDLPASSPVETNAESDERGPVDNDDYCSCSEGCDEEEPEGFDPVEEDMAEPNENIAEQNQEAQDNQQPSLNHVESQTEKISEKNIEDGQDSQTRGNKKLKTNLIECLFCRGKLPGRSILVHLKNAHRTEKEMNLVIQVICDRLKELRMYRDGDEDIDKIADTDTDTDDGAGNRKRSHEKDDGDGRSRAGKQLKRRAKEKARKNFESTLTSDGSDGSENSDVSEEEDGESGGALQCLLNYRAITQSYKCQHCDFVSPVASDFRIHMLNKHIEQANYIDIAKLVEDQTVYALNPSEDIMIQCSFCDRRRCGRGILRHLLVWHTIEDTYAAELRRVCEELKKIGLYMVTDEDDHSKGFSCERKTYWHYKLNVKEDFQLYIKHRFGVEDNESQMNCRNEENNESQDEQRTETTNPKKRKKRLVQSKIDIKCPKCDFKTTTTDKAVDHLKAHHSDIPDEEMKALLEGVGDRSVGRKTSCKLCGMTGTTFAMVNHLKLWHKDDPRLNSEIERAASMNAKRTQRRVEWAELREKGFCCHCKQTVGKDQLKEHKKACSHNKLERTRQLKCSFCDYQAESKKDLSAHKLVTHRAERKTYVCELCGASYLSASGLFTHRSVKHDINRKQDFKCDKCGKIFKMKAVFERHLLTHSDVHLAKCDVCNKVYKTKQDLNVHYKRMHLNIYPYHCERCGHGVQRKEFLARHQCHNVKPRQPRKNNIFDPFPAPAIPMEPTQDIITIEQPTENPTPSVEESEPVWSTWHEPHQAPGTPSEITLQIQPSNPQPIPTPHRQTPVSSMRRHRPPTSLSITPPYSTIPHPQPLTTPVQSTPIHGILDRRPDIQNISPPNALPINIPIMVSVPPTSAEHHTIQLTPLVNQLALNTASSITLPFSPQTPIPLLSTMPSQESDLSDQNITPVTQSYSSNLTSKDVAWANTSWPLT